MAFLQQICTPGSQNYASNSLTALHTTNLQVPFDLSTCTRTLAHNHNYLQKSWRGKKKRKHSRNVSDRKEYVPHAERVIWIIVYLQCISLSWAYSMKAYPLGFPVLMSWAMLICELGEKYANMSWL